jgi:DNA end-binding protein Ku
MAARKSSSRKSSGSGGARKKSAAGKSASKRAGAKSAPKRAAASKRSRGSAAARPAGQRRPIWQGQLRLALVSVPVVVFPATSTGARLSFHQVHAPSGKRIRYEKVVPGMGPVDTDDIVKGFEISKDRYVLLEDEEIDAVKLEARKTVDLVQFVDHCEIDPIWFDRPYYVAPDGELAEDAYRVIRDALRSTRKVGIGQLVLRGRESIVALKPCGDGLMMETLRFADEVRNAAPFFADVGKGKSEPELLELAETLIEKKVAPYDPERFKDQYTEALRAVIEAKAKKKKPVEVEDEEAPRGGAEIIDLVEALKRSVRGGDSRKSGSGKSVGGKSGSGGSRRRKAG